MTSSVYTVMAMIPPAIKWRKSVTIWATVSEVNMKEVTYENGTTAIGYKIINNHIPSYHTPAILEAKRITRIGMKLLTRSARMLAAQYPKRLIPEMSYMCLS